MYKIATSPIVIIRAIILPSFFMEHWSDLGVVFRNNKLQYT